MFLSFFCTIYQTKIRRWMPSFILIVVWDIFWKNRLVIELMIYDFFTHDKFMYCWYDIIKPLFCFEWSQSPTRATFLYYFEETLLLMSATQPFLGLWKIFLLYEGCSRKKWTGLIVENWGQESPKPRWIHKLEVFCNISCKKVFF